MKKFLRTIFVNGITLAFASSIFPGLTYGHDLTALLLAALALTIINLYLRPIVKLFLLPINLLTLGMFRWLTGVICLFVLTLIIPQIQIKGFYFEGLSFADFVVPPFYFSPLFSLITGSFIISLTTSFIFELFKR